MDTLVDSLSSTTEPFAQTSACFTQDLSAVYWQDPAHSTLQNLLSSLRQANADIAAAREEIPTDPYDRLKYEYGCLSAEPFDFDSIEVPEDFCPLKATEKLNEISDAYAKKIDSHLQILSGIDINEHPNIGNAFANFSEDKFVVDQQKTSNYLMFIDMIRNVPISYIKSNPTEFTQKVITKYIQLLGN
jgi:hypothetical protein